jgi:hypothetical protein
MPQAGVVVDATEQAIGRVQGVVDTRGPRPPAVYPDPQQLPVTTRQWAEVTRLRAESLRQQGQQVSEQAKHVQQAAQALLAWLHRSPEDRDLGEFTRVNPIALVSPTLRPRR